MKRTLLSLAVALPVSSGCPRQAAQVAAAAERFAAEEEIASWEDLWLGPAQVAPPTIDFEARRVEDGAITATLRPIRAEDADWNQWSAEGYRLFNNRAAYLFVVEVTGPGPLRWVPDGSRLELNEEGNTLTPAKSSEELLYPLLYYADRQEHYVLDGDLVARTRAAGPFRDAYLPLAEASDPLQGLVAFPADAPDLQVVALRVTLRVEAADGMHDLAWLYD